MQMCLEPTVVIVMKTGGGCRKVSALYLKNEEGKKKNILHAQETSYDISWAFSLSPFSFSHRPSSLSSC